VSYIGGEFAQALSRGGDKGIAAMGSVISQTMYKEFSGLNDALLYRVEAYMVVEAVKTCEDAVSTLDAITPEQVKAFCLAGWNDKLVMGLVDTCDNVRGVRWNATTSITQE
jgi:hypothetical protein